MTGKILCHAKSTVCGSVFVRDFYVGMIGGGNILIHRHLVALWGDVVYLM